MTTFETVLVLALVSIVLLHASRKFSIPYPTMLALAGVLLAASPWVPDIGIDPRATLAVFISPALLDAAYTFPPSALRRYWIPLLVLAAVAVLVTTAAVAGVAMAWVGMPLAAAVALGAIVSPPDEAAATAMISQLRLPRSTLTVLTGESLLNDTVALFLYGAAVAFAVDASDHVGVISQIAVALPGAVVLGVIAGAIYLLCVPQLSGTMSGVLFGFVTTFGTWEAADRLNLSPTMAVVALAMTVARYLSDRQQAHDRVYSETVWQLVVFALNAVAFLLVGLQARAIVLREIAQDNLWHALAFAGGVFVVVVFARFVCIGVYYQIMRHIAKRHGQPSTTGRQSIVVAWCGMRGLVTLATALALPEDFPSRDLIVLSALAVVLGTLIVQGLTLGPLIRALRFPADPSFANELSAARISLLDAAIASLHGSGDESDVLLRRVYEVDKAISESSGQVRSERALNLVRRRLIRVQRERLAELRRDGNLEDDVFRELERTLDLAELATTPATRIELN